MDASVPMVSVVIPVYNEEPGLQGLFERLYPALDRLEVPYEVVLVDDGSRDRSAAMTRSGPPSLLRRTRSLPRGGGCIGPIGS